MKCIGTDQDRAMISKLDGRPFLTLSKRQRMAFAVCCADGLAKIKITGGIKRVYWIERRQYLDRWVETQNEV